MADLDRPLAIAVSGGVDSMALMHLVAAWRQQGGGAVHPPPLILTVDHGLRPASAEEALFVAGAARDLGFPHETLAWVGAKPASGIQDAARRARYDLLLGRLATDDQRRDLLLAHHREDQAETVLMRLARGSGVEGLSAMRPVDHRTVLRLEAPVREVQIRLRRPLLAVPKGRLVATLRARHVGWRDDPSNADIRFERVRLRRAQGELSDLGLTPENIARSARRLDQERAALHARARSIAAAHVSDHGGAFGEFRLPCGPDWLISDVVRILSRLLDVFGGEASGAQLSQIEALAERVLSPGAGASGRLTLGGCIVDIRDDTGRGRVLSLFRETRRTPLPSLLLQPGAGVFWDRRFYVSLAASAPVAVRVGPCDPAMAKGRPDGLPRLAVAGLPAVSTDAGMSLLWGQESGDVVWRWPPQHRAALRWQHGSDCGLETI